MTHFTRSHGLSNDYLVADPAELPVELNPARIRLICDRHCGAGSDGILLLTEAHGGADFGLRILNPDGSEAEKSGNGIRIFAKWLFDTRRADRARFTISTPGGPVAVELETLDERAIAVTARMGRPEFRSGLDFLEISGKRLPVVALSLGNPHCVVPRARLDEEELRWLGPLIEHHPAFPDRTNVQLARVLAPDHIEALIWERGAGETMASGSSACAVAAAFHRLGEVDDEVRVSMPGGSLEIRFGDEGIIWMHGPAEEVATITLSPEFVERLRTLG